MSVYRRYFKILDAATLAEIERLWQLREKYMSALREIKEELGAQDVHTYSNSGHLAGFGFEKTPDAAVYRSPERGIFYPKKSSKVGKEICKKIDAISRPKQIEEALRVTGLVPGFSGALNEGMTFYSSTIAGGPAIGWFASIPWCDVDPAELEKYRANNEMEKRSGSMNHLCWEPPVEWEEIKEWQIKKAFEDAKAEA